MTNKAITALTAATALAGTEVLPIVQSGITVKVTADDLTVKNIRSNATSGVLQIADPTAASTRVVTVPNANWTAARTDAAQSFTGDQTLSTGNLIQGTAAKGINFTANTPAAGMTSQLLNWYEEGTWTPVVYGYTTTGTGTYETQQGYYTRIGNQITINMYVNVIAHTGTGLLIISGLPFAPRAGLFAAGSARHSNLTLTAGNVIQILLTGGSTAFAPEQIPVGGGTAANIPLSAVFSLAISATYFI